MQPALQAAASRLLVIRSRFTTLTGSIIEPLDLDRCRVVAEDLDDLDGTEGDPQPPQGRELVIVDL
jgi:hypothetical protein